jgi:glycosyl-4,4'-diaponeurosporenoate acyltransferase
MTALVWAANFLGWPLLQLGIARSSLSIPLENFAGSNALYEPRSWERDGRVYRDLLRIRKWKSILPDGASWFGAFSKKKLLSRDPDYLRTFLLETRRAEFAHWIMLFCFPIFFLWNPPWARLVMLAYAVFANLPFILVQRYNRVVLARLDIRSSKGERLRDRVGLCHRNLT